MSTQFGIVHALWNHAADGGALLDRVAGEVGIDHVTVPVITGELEEFRLGVSTEQPYFHTEGGWHFLPTTKSYAASGLRPIKARWFGTTDALARLREHVERLSLRLVTRIDLRSVRALVENEPHLAQRNAWGQEVPLAGPCVSNSNLRELLRATIEDLQRYQPTGYQLAHWEIDRGVYRATPRPLDWQIRLGRELDTCFCPACRQIAERAGVEPDQAARCTRLQVKKLIECPPSSATEGDSDDVVRRYCEARSADGNAWLQRLSQGLPEVRLRQLWTPPYRVFHAPAGVLEHVVRWPSERPVDDDYIAALLRYAAQFAAGWALHVWKPCFDDAARLVRLVTEASHLQVPFFDFEGLDEAPAEAITWLKQAVRFARRA